MRPTNEQIPNNSIKIECQISLLNMNRNNEQEEKNEIDSENFNNALKSDENLKLDNTFTRIWQAIS